MTDRRILRGNSATFVLPAVALYATFVLLPVFMSVLFSFLSWSGSGGEAKFAGMANYAELFVDLVFYKALLHNFVLAIASVVIQIPIALALAVAFQHATQTSRALRALAFSPMILPSAVVATLFMLLYNPFEGPLNTLLNSSFGKTPDWLGNESLVLYSLIAAISWRFIGLHMMILLASLQSIDVTLYEAASLDGAGNWQRFRHITLPEVSPALKLVVLLSVLGSLKYFDLVYIMTGGGPNHASELLSTYLFNQGIHSMKFGYSSAIATVLLVVSLATGAGIYAFRKRTVKA